MRRITPRKLLSVSLIVVLLFLPALFTLYKGQVNILLLLLLASIWLLQTRKRATLAGSVPGIPVMAK